MEIGAAINSLSSEIMLVLIHIPFQEVSLSDSKSLFSALIRVMAWYSLDNTPTDWVMNEFYDFISLVQNQIW